MPILERILRTPASRALRTFVHDCSSEMSLSWPASRILMRLLLVYKLLTLVEEGGRPE